MTRVSLVVVVLALGLTQAFGQEVEQTLENQPEKGVVGRIVDDLIESTRCGIFGRGRQFTNNYPQRQYL